MKFSFVLDRPLSKEPTYIFILASLLDGRLKYSIKERILPSHWSREFQLPTPVKDKKLQEDYKALERKLTRIKNGLHDLIRTAKTEGRPITKADAMETILHATGMVKKQDKTNFYEAANIIIEEMTTGLILTPKGNRYTRATLINYHECIKAMKKLRPALRFSEIDMNFYNAFVQQLFAQDLSLASAGTHIKCLKRLLSLAFDKGWHKNTIFRDRQFKTLKEETEDIYLSEEELLLMWEHEVTGTMEVCRDWFLLDCYTGLRISDVKQLTKENIGKETILIANEKTDVKVEIPIHPIVRSILKKYSGLPPQISEQKINKYIKQVGEKCSIDETVLYTITKGGVRKDFYYKKWQMISNHTARRSFVTNLRKAGVPDTLVMKLSGISKASTLLRYDKLTAKEAAKEAAKHSFFQNK